MLYRGRVHGISVIEDSECTSDSYCVATNNSIASQTLAQILLMQTINKDDGVA